MRKEAEHFIPKNQGMNIEAAIFQPNDAEMEGGNDLIGALESREEEGSVMQNEEESEDEVDQSDEEEEVYEEEQEEDEESDEDGGDEDDEKDDKEDKDEESEEEGSDEPEEAENERVHFYSFSVEEAKGEDDEHVTLQTQNITELMKSMAFLMEDDVDVTFMQECKVKEEEKGKVANKVKAENYEAAIGPCNKDTKKPSAGVGCISKEDKVKIVVTEHLT